MIKAMLPLIQTLFDIARLRKGPEHIPRSTLLLMLAIFLWLFAVLCQVALIQQIDETDFALELFSALVGISCYSIVVVGFGQGPRLTQTLTAILGCGALVAIVFTVAYVVLQAIDSPLIMMIAIWAIVLWSISVKGHIIASAINRHWYLGMAIAVFVFVLQYVVNAFITSS